VIGPEARRILALDAMKQEALIATIEEIIHHAAYQAVAPHHHRAQAVEGFLRTGEETWDGAGSGRFSRAQIIEDGIYSECAKRGLRLLFEQLADFLPWQVKRQPPITSEEITTRIVPMIRGLVQKDWQDTALRELSQRVFVLNCQGAKAALEAELSTGWIQSAWQVLWICYQEPWAEPGKKDQFRMRWPLRRTIRACTLVFVRKQGFLQRRGRS